MAAAPKEGRRTRAEQRASTMSLILDTAEDLFSQRGYFGVTDQALCGRAEREHRRNSDSGSGPEQFCGHPESLY